jgi:DNA-binding MarR family transcriptional regulator
MSPGDDDPRLLRGLVSHRVLVLSNTLALAAARHYARRFGVRLAEWRVIDALHAGGGRISANHISRWLKTDKAWVGRSVARLVAAGYVRSRPDPAHRRRRLLALTRKGQQTYAAIAAAARKRNENLLRVLTPSERSALERILGKLQARAAGMLAAPTRGFGGPSSSSPLRRRAARLPGRPTDDFSTNSLRSRNKNGLAES